MAAVKETVPVRWWHAEKKKWVDTTGIPWSFPRFEEFTFVVHRRSGAWTVTEQTSGCAVCTCAKPTRKAAIEDASANLRTIDSIGLCQRIHAAILAYGVEVSANA